MNSHLKCVVDLEISNPAVEHVATAAVPNDHRLALSFCAIEFKHLATSVIIAVVNPQG